MSFLPVDVPLSVLEPACGTGVFCSAFLAFVPVAGLSYNYFENFFLAYRKPYLRAPAAQAVPAPSR